MKYREMTQEQLLKELACVQADYEALQRAGLKLNLARGKPDKEQVSLSDGMLDTVQGDFIMDGVDVRNYGELAGLPSCRKLFSEILGCNAEEVMIGGNASLNLMYDLIAKAYTHGLLRSTRPWSQEAKIKFLCPYPGYDRHYNLSLSFGMELIPVPLNADGPDMDMVETLVKDPAVKGMWCVPKYSNPDGYVYSLDTCRRIAGLMPAAPDFALMWDNAYCVHTFDGEDTPFPDMLAICREAGHPDMVYEFASTSKVTYAGGGVSCMATSVDNLKYVLRLMGYQTIGYDKLNQLIHVRFLKDRETTLKHMQKQAALLKPKFDAVIAALDTEIAPLDIATWNKPKGGYFVSLNAKPGTAKETLAYCKQAGVIMTGAGATYPGGVDPLDSNIRIAPSYPPLEELHQALHVFTTCLKLATLKKLIYEQ